MPEREQGPAPDGLPANDCPIAGTGKRVDQNGELLRASEQTNSQRRIKRTGFIGPAVEVAAFDPVGN